MRTEAGLLVPAAQPVVTAGLYASGQCVGSKLTFDLSAFRFTTGVILQSLVLVDQAKQQALMDLMIFDSNPSGTTFTDNSALDIADADMIKIAAAVPISNYQAFNDNCSAFQGNIGIPLNIDRSQTTISLYAALVSRGTPTFAATTDVTLRLGFMSLGVQGQA